MKFWQKNIDNSPLIIFRIFLGFLLAAESFGAIATGWVKKTFIDPEFNFSHIGFEWLKPLPGNGMYCYFALMGVLGILVMIGYKYKWSLSFFTLMWASVYLMQKESYNNHYYLLLLVCIMMLFFPANAYASMDSKQNPNLKSLVMPQWISGVMIFQITLVYLFSVLAKFSPGWLDGSFLKILFSQRANYPMISQVTQERGFHLFLAYSGLLFDLLIVPLLLWKRTRTIAFVLALLFHIFNALTLQIGIFPFFALSFIVFFYPAETIRSIFFKNKQKVEEGSFSYKNNGLFYFFIPFLIVQTLLPLRHYFIDGDVLWTEEGHRLSWRMMLRSRSGYATFRVVDKHTHQINYFDYSKVLTPKQIEWFGNKPDGIWQMAHYIKEQKLKEGKEVSVFVDAFASVNNSKLKRFVDPKVDLANTDWDYFKHSSWILLN